MSPGHVQKTVSLPALLGSSFLGIRSQGCESYPHLHCGLLAQLGRFFQSPRAASGIFCSPFSRFSSIKGEYSGVQERPVVLVWQEFAYRTARNHQAGSCSWHPQCPAVWLVRKSPHALAQAQWSLSLLVQPGI